MKQLNVVDKTYNVLNSEFDKAARQEPNKFALNVDVLTSINKELTSVPISNEKYRMHLVINRADEYTKRSVSGGSADEYHCFLTTSSEERGLHNVTFWTQQDFSGFKPSILLVLTLLNRQTRKEFKCGYHSYPDNSIDYLHLHFILKETFENKSLHCSHPLFKDGKFKSSFCQTFGHELIYT